MEDPVITGDIRNEKGQFAPGVSGNPAGKPPGTVSIVAKIKAKFRENPQYFDEWVDKLLEDGGNRRAIMEQLDGKPKQAVEVTGANGGPVQTIVGMRVIKENGTDIQDTEPEAA
jgi:hypothetical protein